MQTIETGGLTDEAHEHLRTAMFAAFGRTSDRVKSLVGNTRRLLGHRIEGPNERGNSIEYMTVAYDLTPTVSMYVEMFRSVERHPDDDTWCFDVTMMNYSSDPARRVDLKEFLGKEFNLEAWQSLVTYIDPSLQDSEYYSHGLNDICMGIPDTPLKWLGTFLHELGHTTQYQEKPNSLVAVRKFQKTIDAMRGDKEAFDPSIHLRHLPGKEEFVVSLTKMLVVLEERGSISKDEVIEIRGVALSVFLDMNYLCEDWETMSGTFGGLDTDDVWLHMLSRACLGSKHIPDPERAMRTFRRFEQLLNAIFERDATAYALRSLRRMDRELGTNLSNSVFRESRADGTVSESTVHADLSEALSTYRAHRGEGGIAPGTPLPRFSDFDMPGTGSYV